MTNMNLKQQYPWCDCIFISICYAVILFQSLALIAWLFEFSSLGLLYITEYITTPFRGISEILIAITLLLLHKEKFSIFDGTVVIIISGFVFIINSIISIEYFHAHKIIEHSMPLLTSINLALFALIAISLLFSRMTLFIWIYQIITIIVFFGALFSLLGYIFEVDTHYEIVKASRMSIKTSIIVFCLCIAFLLVKPNKSIIKIFLENTIAGFLLRRIPVTICIISAICAIVMNKGAEFGLFDDNFGDLLTLLCNFILFIVVIWISTNFLTGQEKLITHSTQRVQTQYTISQIIKAGKNFNLIAKNILEAICKNLQWDLGEIWLFDETKNALIRSHFWYDQEIEQQIKNFINSNTQFQIGEGIPGVIYKDIKSIWDSNLIQNLHMLRNINEVNFCSMVGIPIFYKNITLGAIILYSQDHKKYDENTLIFLEVIGIQLGEYILHQSTEEKIYQMTDQDNLTGFMNRLNFEEKFNSKLIKNPSALQALITFDIDNFKLINESLGYDAGDNVLLEISKRFSQQNIIEDNLICRLGADKFVFVPDSIKNINQVVESVYKVFSIFKEHFYLKNEEIHCTVSIGISMFPRDGEAVSVLLKNADLALAQAKREGGNNFQFFTKELLKDFSERLVLENELRQAILKNQFTLHFQPKIDLKTGLISSVESLIRWQHPTKGLLQPGVFMPLAEDNGMIIQITEWIIREVFSLLATGALNIPVAINISSHHLRKEHDLANYLKQMVQGFHIHTKNIELEITETVLIEDTQKVLSMFANLRSMGFTLTLDDFGTKFSSLNYLKDIAVDKIKMDKSFVDDVPNNTNNVAIVRAVITLFHALHKKIVAEGAENAEQVKFLVAEGCDEIQGYYFSKPLPLDELQELVNIHKKYDIP